MPGRTGVLRPPGEKDPRGPITVVAVVRETPVWGYPRSLAPDNQRDRKRKGNIFAEMEREERRNPSPQKSR